MLQVLITGQLIEIRVFHSIKIKCQYDEEIKSLLGDNQIKILTSLIQGLKKQFLFFCA